MKLSRTMVLTACLSGALTLTACGSSSAGGDYDWAAPPDDKKIAAQADSFQTIALPDDWANYGEVFKAFCKKHNVSKCEHKDTDASSADAIQRYDAEKGNPTVTASDIGLMWGPVATAKGVVPPYMPPPAEKLRPWQKGEKGGWVATFAGVPSFIVNTDKVKNPPKSWADLLKPEYKGMIATKDPSSSGTGQAMILAAATATGGSADNLDPAYEFFAKLRKSGNLSSVKMSEEALEKGEAPIQINYDFNGVTQKKALAEKDVNVEVFIPTDGSVYSPSGLIINGYNTAKGDFLKAFLEYVLSDEAQLLFAEAGARPIRMINGDLEVPADAKKDWLSEEAYQPVKEIEASKVNPEEIVSAWEQKVLS